MTLQPHQHPNFFVVGTVKGGTTALHRFLMQHPQVYMSPIKETNYFSRLDIDPAHFSEDYRHDVNVDLKGFLAGPMDHPIHIAHVTEEADYLQLFRKVSNEKAIGEVSNSYLLYPNAPEEIHKQYPNAKIIMMLRHPAERAFSQYIMNLMQGKILEKDFLKEITTDDARAVKGWGANHQYLFVGKYYEQVRRYLDIFPKEQVGIFLYEDYNDDQEGTLKHIFRFLEIDEKAPIVTGKYNQGGMPRFEKINYWLNQSGIISWAKRALPISWRKPFKRWMYAEIDNPDMQPEERAWLIDYYSGDITNLQRLTGLDLSHWLR
jgi:hypothetical protein